MSTTIINSFLFCNNKINLRKPPTSLREKLRIDDFKCIFFHHAVGTMCFKASIHSLDFYFTKSRRFANLCERIWSITWRRLQLFQLAICNEKENQFLLDRSINLQKRICVINCVSLCVSNASIRVKYYNLDLGRKMCNFMTCKVNIPSTPSYSLFYLTYCTRTHNLTLNFMYLYTIDIKNRNNYKWNVLLSKRRRRI